MAASASAKEDRECIEHPLKNLPSKMPIFGLPQEDLQALTTAHNVLLWYLPDSSVRFFYQENWAENCLRSAIGHDA